MVDLQQAMEVHEETSDRLDKLLEDAGWVGNGEHRPVFSLAGSGIPRPSFLPPVAEKDGEFGFSELDSFGRELEEF